MARRRLATKELFEETIRQGADLVGVAAETSFKDAPKGHRPRDLLSGARSIICIALALPSAALESAPSREYSISYIVANDELNRIAFRVAKFLEAKGFRALQIPASPPYDLENNSGDLSHRHAAVAAGIGVLGKNSLLITPRFGPMVRLTSVITDAEFEPTKTGAFDPCVSCSRCIDACPAKALKGDGVVDKERCDQHHLKVGEKLQLKDWEQVCGVCIRVCPVGRGRRA